MRLVRERARAMIAVVSVVLLAALAGCSLGAPKLDPTDPINLIYTTRLAIAQTNDTVATAVDTGVMSSKDGRQMQTRLAQAAIALVLAETAVDQGRSSGDYLGTAVKLLQEVRSALQQQGVSPAGGNAEAGLSAPVATADAKGGPMGSVGRRGSGPPASIGQEVRL